MRIFVAQLNQTIGDLKGNRDRILASIAQARKKKADLVLFSELALTGYPPEDFLLLPHFIQAVEEELQKIVAASKGLCVVLGTPRRNPDLRENPLFNSAAVIEDGALIGFQDKSLLPNYDIFNERRYFEPAREVRIWNLRGKKVAITICEDIWQKSQLIPEVRYHRDPVEEIAKHQTDVILNLSASPFSVNKIPLRDKVCGLAAKDAGAPLILCNQVGGNDSIIFDGNSCFVNRLGEVCAKAAGFREDGLLIDLEEAYQPVRVEANATELLYEALVMGLRDYFRKSGFQRACLGISGGIDSAVAACIAVAALGTENVRGVAMPSAYSSEGSVTDARALAANLGIELLEIPIHEIYQTYLDALAPYFKGTAFNTAEENLQSRIRGMLLMALSNKFGEIVLSTGNKSEMATGYATLYGDMCGGLGVLSDVTKQQVYALAEWINRIEGDKEAEEGKGMNRKGEVIPRATIEKPPSAELRPDQKDSDTLPPYDVIDRVVQSYVEEHQDPVEIAEGYGFDLDVVEGIVRMIHRNEYKRRQSAPGLRVSERAFSVGRRFPIVQKWV